VAGDRSSRVGAFVGLGVVAFLVGLATQRHVWRHLETLGVSYPSELVAFLDTLGVAAVLAFVAGALGRRWWQAVIAGPTAILVSFVGYYIAFDTATGPTGAAKWIVLALVAGPAVGVVGWWWSRRGVWWLAGVPVGFLGADLIGLVLDHETLPSVRAADITTSSIAVVLALLVFGRGPLRRRVLLVPVAAAAALVLFLLETLAVMPLLRWLGSVL